MDAIEFTTPPVSQEQDMLVLTIPTKAGLYAAYMPFVQNGGLFVASKKRYHLGDEIIIILKLLDDPDKLTFVGTVVWITPPCAQGGREAGVGVRFNHAEGDAVKGRIENLLAGLLGSEKKTETM